MTATVTALKPARSKPKTPTPTAPPNRSAAWKRKMRRQRVTSYATASVALVLMGLSLSHLAAGVGALTHSDPGHAWSMAVGIDLGFIALEISQLCATSESIRAKIMQWAGPTIIGTLMVSAAMNAYAFASVATGWPVVLSACTLGVSIPMLIYVLTRVSVALWVDAARQ
jgi:hypothetical protein